MHDIQVIGFQDKQIKILAITNQSTSPATVMTLQTPCSLVCTCSNDKCFTDVRTSFFFSSLVFPHPNGHSKRVHADIPGEATSGRVSRDQRLYGKIKVVNLLIGLDLFQREEHCVFLTVRSQFDIAFPKNEFITKTWLYFLTEIKRPGVATIQAIELVNNSQNYLSFFFSKKYQYF